VTRMRHMENTPNLICVDVAKSELVLFDGKKIWAIPNEKEAINSVLKEFPKHRIVCEPTSIYHLELATLAFKNRNEVSLVNPKEIKNYRDCRAFRAKTDRIDACAIYEFSIRHYEALRLWKPPAKQLEKLYKLISQRSCVVRNRVTLRQVFGQDQAIKPVISETTTLVEVLESQISEIAKSYEDYLRFSPMPGVGPLVCATLVYLFNRYEFADDDAAVAFVGIDLRVSDSGKYKGSRRLSKRGDPLIRNILIQGGFGLMISKAASQAKRKFDAAGRHRTEQGVIAARKILRTAYVLHNTKTDFDLSKWHWMVDNET